MLAVHTTGVNWDGLLANAAAIIVIVGAIAALMTKVISRSISDKVTESVEAIVAREVKPQFAEITSAIAQLRDTSNDHGVAIAHLMGFQEGRQEAIAQARLVTHIRPGSPAP